MTSDEIRKKAREIIEIAQKHFDEALDSDDNIPVFDLREEDLIPSLTAFAESPQYEQIAEQAKKLWLENASDGWSGDALCVDENTFMSVVDELINPLLAGAASPAEDLLNALPGVREKIIAAAIAAEREECAKAVCEMCACGDLLRHDFIWEHPGGGCKAWKIRSRTSQPAQISTPDSQGDNAEQFYRLWRNSNHFPQHADEIIVLMEAYAASLRQQLQAMQQSLEIIRESALFNLNRAQNAEAANSEYATQQIRMVGEIAELECELASLKAAGEGWIPCAERLPEMAGQFSFSNRVDFFVPALDKEDRWQRGRLWKNPSHWQSMSAGAFTMEDVTHWRPLPLAPAKPAEGPAAKEGK